MNFSYAINTVQLKNIHLFCYFFSKNLNLKQCSLINPLYVFSVVGVIVIVFLIRFSHQIQEQNYSKHNNCMQDK